MGAVLAISLIVGLSGIGFASSLNDDMARRAPASSANTLSFYNTHTGERLTIPYNPGARYIRAAALSDLENFLRDHRNGHSHDVDADLVALLADLKDTLQKKHPRQNISFHVISGFRSSESNEMLRRAGGGQAKKSMHVEGKAIDIRIPGIDLVEARNAAWCLQRGGVGYYKGSNFIHVDTGKVRYWHWKPSANTCSR